MRHGGPDTASEKYCLRLTTLSKRKVAFMMFSVLEHVTNPDRVTVYCLMPNFETKLLSQNLLRGYRVW